MSPATHQCSGCGRHFSGLSTFDLHRSGPFEPGCRVCLPPQDVGLSPVKRSTEQVTIWGNPGRPDSLGGAA